MGFFRVYSEHFHSGIRLFIPNEGKESQKEGYYGEIGFESEESESVKLLPALEVGNSALHCICEASNYQKRNTGRCAAHTDVVGMDIHIWWSEASWQKKGSSQVMKTMRTMQRLIRATRGGQPR